MSGLYVDASAALKRVFVEADSGSVVRLLRSRLADGEIVATSSLTWVEVSRSILRSGTADVDASVTAALSGIAEIPLRDDLLQRARTIGPRLLRSLDAIHLASALALGATEMLVFDTRLAEAADALGLTVIV